MPTETRSRPPDNDVGDELRKPPYSLPAEQGTLGSMLLDGACIDDVLSEVKATDFYRASHGIIFRTVETMHSAGEPIDAFSIQEALQRRGELDRAGGMSAVLELVHAVPSAASAQYCAQIVKQHSIRRQVIELCQEGLTAAYSTDGNEDVVALLESGLLKIDQGNTQSEPITFAEAIDAAYHSIIDRREGKLAGLPSGFPLLDHHLGGFSPGRLIVFAARPAMGKTALALNITEAIAATGAPCLIFSREMAATELAIRSLSGKARIPATILQQVRHLTAHDIPRIESAARDLSPLPIFIEDSSDPSIGTLERIARQYTRKQRIKFIVVDYLQLLDASDTKRGRTRQEIVAEISRRLKFLARQLQVPILALSQLNRGVEDREDKRPRLSDIRESGAIEQDADQIVMVHRPEYYDPKDKPGVVEFIIAKNRHGSSGIVEAAFEGAFTRFYVKEELGDLPFSDDLF